MFAHQIACLLNAENHLSIHYTADKVAGRHFIVSVEDCRLIGCVEVAKVQWYQAEISHLAVVSDRRRKGVGFGLLQKAKQHAAELGCRVAQATIRSDNVPCISLFEHAGWRPATEFTNNRTGNEVTIYQVRL